MSAKGSYTRYALLASASSLVFVLPMLLISYSEDGAHDDIGMAIGGYLWILLFGAFVLVPHLPRQTRTPVRVIFLVCLPLLLGWALFGVVEGLSHVLDRFIDQHIPIAVWVTIDAVAGGAWVLGLTYATLRTAKLSRSGYFWRYVTLLAIVVAVLIFGFGINFCMFFCSKWNEPALIVSGVLLLLVTPIGVTTALHFGAEAC